MIKFLNLLNKKLPQAKTFDNMKQVLAELHAQGHTLGIITSNKEKGVKTFLENNDINCFDFVISSFNLFGKDKKIKKVSKALNFDKKDVFYVCDETRDIISAKKAGVNSVAVTWGYLFESVLKKEKPDFLVDFPEQLLNIF